MLLARIPFVFFLLFSVSAQAAELDTTAITARQQGEIELLKKNLSQFERFALYKASCKNLFQDLYSWSAKGGGHNVQYIMTSTKSKTADSVSNWGFGAFSEGTFARGGTGTLIGTSDIFFSDRKNGTQGFAASSPDKIEITLNQHGHAKLKLLTWGAEFDFDGVICQQDGYGATMIGRVLENNGSSMVTIALHKIKSGWGR